MGNRRGQACKPVVLMHSVCRSALVRFTLWPYGTHFREFPAAKSDLQHQLPSARITRISNCRRVCHQCQESSGKPRRPRLDANLPTAPPLAETSGLVITFKVHGPTSVVIYRAIPYYAKIAFGSCRRLWLTQHYCQKFSKVSKFSR